MSKEKVFIVLSHKLSLRSKKQGDWQTVENIEFVNELRKRHYTTSSAIVDYANQKIITGSSKGFDTFEKFDTYARNKYPKHMKELDTAYSNLVVPSTEIMSIESLGDTNIITDQFGTVREATVFD